uniref:Retrotransposon gag domain-containing protein n=2 Tax=Noccaea caerulescens TaxID=107243 RepID=A0A1J3F4Z3_NOCCA
MMSLLEVPIFRGEEGDDLRLWISSMEYEFRRWNFTDSEKLNLANAVIDGKARVWFQGIQSFFPFRSWKELRNELSMKFGDDDDPETIKLRIESDRCIEFIMNGGPRKRHSESVKIQRKISVDETSSEKVARSESIQGTKSQEATSSTLEIDFTQHTIPQIQVPISDWEPSHRKDLLELLSTTVIVKTQIDDDLGEASWDYLNASMDRLQSHSSLKFVNDKHNAHELFERMLLRKHRLQHKRKLSLSPKSWMFKFKNMNLQRSRSQMDPYQAIDRSVLSYPSPCYSAKVGLGKMRRTFQSLSMMNQAHLSMLMESGTPKTVLLIGKRVMARMDQKHLNSLLEHRRFIWHWFCPIESLDQSTYEIEVSQSGFSVTVADNMKELQPHGDGIILISSSLGSSLFSREGVYKRVPSGLLIVDVLICLLSSASENKDAAGVFQFLQITKSANVTLRLAQPISTAIQVTEAHTTNCSIQRPFSCVRRWTIKMVSHLWHRWKAKVGILQIVSELVLPKVNLFQVTKWQGFCVIVRDYREKLELYFVIVEHK